MVVQAKGIHSKAIVAYAVRKGKEEKTLKPYEETVCIGYFESDARLCLNPSALMVHLQDTAIRHSDSLGYTLDYMANWRRGWALINWHIVIHRTPKCGETLRIATWSDKCRRMQAERCFLLYDEKGEIVIRAASRWAFMDLENRCPTQVPEEMEQKYGSANQPVIPNEKYKFPKQEEGAAIQRRTFTVTRRDTDNNGHVNNVKYIEWAMDDVADEVYDAMALADLKVVYRKECYKGDEILSKCVSQALSDGSVEVISSFVCPQDEKQVYAQVASVWRHYET